MEESGVISASSSSEASTKTETETKGIGETLTELCAVYMKYGMSYGEFWHSRDNTLFAVYQQMHYNEQKRIEEEYEHDDYVAWLHGMYVHEAVQVALSNAFRKKGAKPIEYQDKPITFRLKQQRADKKRLEEAEKARVRLAMDSLIRKFTR